MKAGSGVVRYIAAKAVPFIQLYALYVLGHGEDGPGGGFQGGVIFGASFALLGLTEGWRAGRRHAREGVTDALLPTGCLVYAGTGVLCLLLGGRFLEYDALAADGDARGRAAAHHALLMSIEVGVMITVAAAMVTLFFELGRLPADAEEHEDAEAGPAPAGGGA